METTARNVFQREKKPFQMMGQEFYFEFIPSEHFQSILLDLLNVMMRVIKPLEEDDKTEAEVKKSEQAQADYIMQTAQRLLNERVYLILSDVLTFQNNRPASDKLLRKTTSPLELAEFIGLLLEDSEILEAVSKLMGSLGKFAGNLPQTLGIWSALLPTLNSTPSSPTTSDSTESTLTNDLAVNKSEDTSLGWETIRTESTEEEVIHPLNPSL